MAVYIATFLSFLMHVGFGGSKLTLSLTAIASGASPATIGMMMSLMALFPTLLAVPMGKFTDRSGVRRPMLFGCIGVTIGLAAPFAVPSITTLFVSAMLLGTSFTAYQVAVSNLIGAVDPPERRARNYSVLSLGFAAASFLGPLTAGLAIDNLGHRTTFLVLAFWAAIPTVVLLVKPKLLPNMRVKQTHSKSGGVLDLVRIPRLRDTFIAGGILSSAWDLYQFILPIYAHKIGLSATVIGLILAAFATAIVTVRVFIPAMARRYSEAQLITGAIFVAGSAYVLFPFFESPWMLAAVSFLLGTGVGCGQPLAMTLIYNLSPPGRAGEASGLRVSVNHMTHIAVPLLFGSMGAAIGFMPVFLANGSLLLASGWVSKRNYLK